MIECAKKAGAIWNTLSDSDKSKWNKAHLEDVER